MSLSTLGTMPKNLQRLHWNVGVNGLSFTAIEAPEAEGAIRRQFGRAQEGGLRAVCDRDVANGGRRCCIEARKWKCLSAVRSESPIASRLRVRRCPSPLARRGRGRHPGERCPCRRSAPKLSHG